MQELFEFRLIGTWNSGQKHWLCLGYVSLFAIFREFSYGSLLGNQWMPPLESYIHCPSKTLSTYWGPLTRVSRLCMKGSLPLVHEAFYEVAAFSITGHSYES